MICALHKHDAPETVLTEFLSFLANVDVQLSASLAHKVQCCNFVVDLHLSQKDRLSLVEYIQSLPPHSTSRVYAQTVLNGKVSIV